MKRVIVKFNVDDFEKLSKRASVHNISVSEYIQCMIMREIDSDRFDAVTIDLLMKSGKIDAMKSNVAQMRKISGKLLRVLDRMESEIDECDFIDE